MIESYIFTATLLFIVHFTLRHRYQNSITRCVVWAVLWPLDIAAVLHDWMRSGPIEGGAIDTAQLVKTLKDVT